MANNGLKWHDFFKIFTYSFAEDPLSRKRDKKDLAGAGVTQPDAMPDLRNQDGLTAGSGAYIRVQNDMIDVQTATSRLNRYKEYTRLGESVPEIDRAMTVFADEACVAGRTNIATVFDGYKSIEWLVKNKKERFPVYCFDFEKMDYTIGWAFDPRYVKHAETVKLLLDDGNVEIITPDHRILKRDGSWIWAGELKEGDELMPFYKIRPNQYLTKLKIKQFPRIYTHSKGWIHERQFIDEWRLGKELPQYESCNRACRMIHSGLTARKIAKLMNRDWQTVEAHYQKEGFSFKEIRYLANRKVDRRRVIGVQRFETMPVYDLSVETHENFCTDSTVMHNCQKNDEDRVFVINCKDKEVVSELNYVMFHRERLNLNQRNIWDKFRRTCIKGDAFWELVIDPDDPKNGLCKISDLQPETMYRIETTKGRLVEFQQTREGGPDYKAIENTPIETASESDFAQANAIRFAPKQIVHIRLGDFRRLFYPYGVSLIEPARGPAHQLRMMEDAMVVYRLCLTKDARVRTYNGWKYINEIELNDTVYSIDECGTPFLTKIIWTVNNGVQKVYKVKSQHCEITGTATHPILINRDGVIQYVDIQNLMPKKDMVINVTSDEEKQMPIPRCFSEKWARLNESGLKEFKNKEYENISLLLKKCQRPNRAKQFLYSEGKSLPANEAKDICIIFGLSQENLIECNKQEYAPEIVNLPEFVDDDFARLFGFLIGDGSIRATGVGAMNQLHFSSSPDKELNEKYANLIIKFFGKIRFERDKRSARQLGNYTLDSHFACKLFTAMGYIPGAKNKRIPSWVFSSSKSIRRAFVEGISDADGCERYTKVGLWFSTISLCNKKLVEDIKELWHGIGLCNGKITHRKREGGHEIVPGRKMKPTESWGVTITDRLLPKYEKVWSVDYVGEEEVFDVTVDNKYHNIVVNGIITHQTRAPERRVFYIDVGQLPPFKAEAFMERLKDQFRKKKVVRNNNTSSGASAVEERFHPIAADEDFWLPLRKDSNTRIETLPGAQNLGEIDDTVYFRNKLFTALNFPPNYFANEDINSTRITLSAQNVQFAMLIERLQSYFEEALYEVADRHLTLRGFPPESYEDLKIHMNPPSAWREMSNADITTNRINNMNSVKGSQLMADLDILMKYGKHTEDEAKEMISRNKIQKLEDLKLQIIAQNPILAGIGNPAQNNKEIGSEPGGPNPMLGGDEGQPPSGPGGQPGQPQVFSKDKPSIEGEGEAPDMLPSTKQGKPLPQPSEEEILRYDLEIQDYSSEQDEEDIDYSELGQ